LSQTDRRTDRRTRDDSLYRTSIALCGKIHKKTDKHSHTQEHTEKEREKRQTER